MRGTELSTERVGVSRERFGPGMYALGENAGRAISADTVAVFYGRLHDRMTEREWVALVEHVLDHHEGNGGWAPVATLLRYLDEMRDSEAAEGVSEAELVAAEAAADLAAKGRA